MSKPRRLDRVAWWIIMASIGATTAFILCGCRAVDPAALVKALANDPATATLTFPTPYGLVKYNRSNPGTNSSVTIHPDGSITIDTKSHVPPID